MLLYGITPRHAVSSGIMAVLALSLTMSTGCGSRYKEKVVVAKQFTALERARQTLESYVAGQPMGTEFMGFHLLKEELVKSHAEQGSMVAEAISKIEKVLGQPAEIKAIAQKTLAELNKPVTPP